MSCALYLFITEYILLYIKRNVLLTNSFVLNFWHHFNSVLIHCTERRTQTKGSQTYSPFLCAFSFTVEISCRLISGRYNLDVTRVKVCSSIPLSYNSNMSMIRKCRKTWMIITGLRTTVSLIKNCFPNRKIQEWWIPENEQCLWLIDTLMHPKACQRSECHMRFLEAIKTHQFRKKKRTKVSAKSCFLYDYIFCIFDKRPWLAVT